MAATVWGAWGEEWALNEKVSFNGSTRRIVVNAGVTSLNLRTDVYSAWVRWVTREENSRFLPAIRGVGGDPIPGSETGLTFFLYNGWKLVYDPSVVAANGVLYSEDFDTAFWSADDQPIYPATVAALVNTAGSAGAATANDVNALLTAALQNIARENTALATLAAARLAAALSA